ncbi:hypothetical protein [Saccharopolyspora sp. NPDC049426]|uniref:hypothetical protein n=1 Tax=Saccharopolyspora sp. NPDC049426 TaxID=3155652 RepID=UPI003440FC23
MPELEPGTLSSWVSALTALMALALTFLTVFIATRQYKVMRRQYEIARGQYEVALNQIQHRDEKDDKEEAAKVAAWLNVHVQDGFPKVFLHYVNDNNVPVFNFVASLALRRTRAIKIPVVEPTGDDVKVIPFDAASEWARNYIEAELTTALKPTETTMPLPPVEAEQEKESRTLSHQLQSTGVFIQFQDTRNAIWRRDPRGFLDYADINTDPIWRKIFLWEDKMYRSTPHLEESGIICDIFHPGGDVKVDRMSAPYRNNLAEESKAKPLKNSNHFPLT